MSGSAALGEDEAREVLDDLARLREEPPPGDPSAAGCVVGMVALVLLVFMPVLTRAPSLDARALMGIGGVLLATAVGGAATGLLGGRRAAERAETEVDARVRRLREALARGDERAARSAALALLTSVAWAEGSVRRRAYDPDAVAARLGGDLPHVIRLERFLVGRGELEPVFGEDR